MTTLTLVLARGPGNPDGDIRDRLTINLTLTAQGQIDVNAHQADPNPWLAASKRPGAPDQALEVIRIDEGWALQSTSSMDDPIWLLQGHVFRPGELVRLQRPDGESLLYRIVAFETAAV